MAAIYCRVSTSDQDCERQERDLRAYAKRAGYRVTGVWKETASGAKVNRAQRAKVIALARSREINLILVTELTRWGRSTADLLTSLHDLQAWNVSLVAKDGFQFDLSTAQGKLIAGFMAGLAEFERDLLRERVKSGIAAAKARGVVFGRKRGPRPLSVRHTPRVLELVEAKVSYREISRRIGIRRAAEQVCTVSGARDLGTWSKGRDCASKAIARAVSDVGSPTLTQVYAVKTGISPTNTALASR